ncbi:uncharacterized protein PITG_05847 [Phytophthora infestans T30-4]|uniref:Uncharacterized protein n=1 Tax=Phytophthora infestans (strain T30-4) TaxID=403677 RepID=D0N5U1_PHYIT|nr:uncharacterized protein PITG_05847 [Phytophthora infestans T30-4]EEY70432.1 hypothetical protein PITG_05847 [Phytophthora infestans T30-4]|eukprot:XP_002998086.1 hypothetical protein PITG_05847 [Phytophthora infestans T30-4]
MSSYALASASDLSPSDAPSSFSASDDNAIQYISKTQATPSTPIPASTFVYSYGRPKSSVWTLFSEASENGRVKGLRCSTEKSNPKAHKLESHFMHCQDYTLEERKKRKRTAIERKEKDIRKRRRQRGVQLDGEDALFSAHLGSTPARDRR